MLQETSELISYHSQYPVQYLKQYILIDGLLNK